MPCPKLLQSFEGDWNAKREQELLQVPWLYNAISFTVKPLKILECKRNHH